MVMKQGFENSNVTEMRLQHQQETTELMWFYDGLIPHSRIPTTCVSKTLQQK
jgi:hypothetical protein